MMSSTFLFICIQACILQTVLSKCGCGYSNLPTINYGSSVSSFGVGDCGCGGVGLPSISTISVPSIGVGYGCADIGLGLNIGSAGVLGSSAIVAARPSIGSVCDGAYGGVGSGQVGVAGDVCASGNTCVVGSVPVLGAVDFSGVVPACGSVSISGQCGCGCA